MKIVFMRIAVAFAALAAGLFALACSYG